MRFSSLRCESADLRSALMGNAKVQEATFGSRAVREDGKMSFFNSAEIIQTLTDRVSSLKQL
jgi:hypothetical protein